MRSMPTKVFRRANSLPPQPVRRRLVAKVRDRLLCAEVERLEERTLLSILPTPTSTAHVDIVSSSGNHSSPSIAVDPLDATRTVSVWTDVNAAGIVSVEGSYSTDGGHTWTALRSPGRSPTR